MVALDILPNPVAFAPDILLDAQNSLILLDPPIDSIRIPLRRARARQARLSLGRYGQGQDKG